MGLIVFHEMFLNIFHIQTKCGKYMGTYYGNMSVPHNTAMDLNNVMYKLIRASLIQPNIIMILPSS